MRIVAFCVEGAGVARRLALLGGILCLTGLAGCSSSSRFDGYDNGFSYGPTGSLRSGDNYSSYNGTGYNGTGYNGTGYNRNGYNGNGHRSNGNNGAVERGGLAPLNGGDNGGGYENGSYSRRDGGYANGGDGAGYEGKRITVAPGDTLHSLAGRYDVSPDEIAEANGLRSRTLYSGQRLIIPAYGRDYSAAPSGGGHKSPAISRPPFTPASLNARREAAGACPDCYRVKEGDTMFTVARHYGLGPAHLAHHNNLAVSAALRPGQNLKLPQGGYDAGGNANLTPAARKPQLYVEAKAPAAAAPGAAPRRKDETRMADVATDHRHYAPGGPGARSYESEYYNPDDYARDSGPDYGAGRAYAPPARAPDESGYAAREPRRAPDYRSNHVREPAREPARNGRQAPQPAPAPQEAVDRAPPPPPPSQTAATQPPAAAAAPAPGSGNCDDLLANPLPRSGETFRMPVEGLIISKFGQKDDGTFNDGVNISVPKGTPVKASENGVVAYVGTEISGFGHLILVRHAGDFVTAYAHNDEVLVERCAIVRRGQIIAKAGATGSVTKPQLHFEVRQASRPVDPEQYFGSRE